MSYQIDVRVDPDHSVDPSYIVHYRITKDGALVHSGITQHHRHAEHNQLPLVGKIPQETRTAVEKRIQESVAEYVKQKHEDQKTPLI